MRNFNTLFVGKVVLHFPELASTNQYAVEQLAKTKPSEGTVVTTDYQSAGRGQIGSSWQAEPGQNIHLSVLFYPHWLAARRQFSFSQAMALAVADTISLCTNQQAQVKWPNDVYMGDRKLAGILIQNSLQGGHMQWSVVGIGINVNQRNFSSDLRNPSSLSLVTGESFALADVQQSLYAHLEQRYLQLKRGDVQLQADYLKQLYRINEKADYRDVVSDTLFKGQIEGVSDQGKLLIRDEDGTLRSFGLKEVHFL